MGIYVRYLLDVPRGYSLYGIFIANPYGTAAEKVITENFEKIAYGIGSKNIIAKILTWEGAAEAEKKFGIKTNDLRPILIITEIHPAEWTSDDPMVKIQLGKIGNEDDMKNFLFQITQWFATEDLGKIQWELRLQRLKEITRHLPAIIEIIKP